MCVRVCVCVYTACITCTVTPERPGAYLSEIKNKPPPDRRNNNYRRLPAPHRDGTAPILSERFRVCVSEKDTEREIDLHCIAAAATAATTTYTVIGHNDIKILLLSYTHRRWRRSRGCLRGSSGTRGPCNFRCSDHGAPPPPPQLCKVE